MNLHPIHRRENSLNMSITSLIIILIIIKLSWKIALSKLFAFFSIFRKILRSSINNETKQRILNAYLALTFTTNAKSVKSIKLGNFQVDYSDLELLKYMFKEIFIGNGYLFRTNTSNPFIIDCGSNIGMSVLFFNLIFPDCRILAFEPDEFTFHILEKNVKQNNLEDVVLQNMALSDHDGVVDFYYDQEHPSRLQMSTLENRMPKQKKEVKSTRLSNFIQEEVDFLKLDIEGTEIAVIQDLKEENKIRLINQMVIEYHHHIDKDKDSLSKILTILEESNFGYQIDSSASRPWKSKSFQDLLLFAYRK